MLFVLLEDDGSFIGQFETREAAEKEKAIIEKDYEGYQTPLRIEERGPRN